MHDDIGRKQRKTWRGSSDSLDLDLFSEFELLLML